MDPKLAPAYANYAAALDQVEKVDDMTVVVHTKHPYPPFELMLTQVYVTPPAYWASTGLDALRPEADRDGPLQVRRVGQGQSPRDGAQHGLLGQAGHRGSTGVIWRPVPDDMSRVAGFVTGEYDIATNIPISAIEEINSQADRKVDRDAELSHLPARSSPRSTSTTAR